MFADDILLMFRANPRSLNTIQQIFSLYAKITGQTINLAKSEIFFPRNTSRATIRTLSSKLQMKVGSFPFKYLRAIIAPRRPPSTTYNFILGLIKAKLGSWRSAFLSQAGRVILINSSCIDKIEQNTRNFLWSDTPDKKAIHHISWDTVTLPKSEGGLGIHDIHTSCLALQAKRIQCHLNKLSSPWSDIVKAKYQDPRLPLSTNSKSSWSWQLFFKAFSLLAPGFFKVTNGGIGMIVRNAEGICLIAKSSYIEGNSPLVIEALAVQMPTKLPIGQQIELASVRMRGYGPPSAHPS
ncbi:ribonuclease H protein [Canna indica]|uniref:Ribonuclease H protein n=1 Tax=Canna indica TaxID=4628 RepID=A0AAQ3PZE0_9LILI|nr:ribonuclease H protein [Canna indica]